MKRGGIARLRGEDFAVIKLMNCGELNNNNPTVVVVWGGQTKTACLHHLLLEPHFYMWHLA
jgi:hypothetical protein